MKFRYEVIMEEDDFLIIDKPPGLLSIPDREGKEKSLKDILKEKYGQIFTVHRLDRETSGLILFAKTPEAHKHFSRQFEDRRTVKIYQGLVIGSPVQKSGTIDSPIAEHPAHNGKMITHRNGKEALTDYEVLEDFKLFSLLQFRIYTGRTHQVRVHMKELGHPIVCDPLYGDGKPLFVSSIKHRYKLSKKEEEEKPIVGRLALHAFQLKLEDSKGKLIDVEAPLPKDMRAAIQQLEKKKMKDER